MLGSPRSLLQGMKISILENLQNTTIIIHDVVELKGNYKKKLHKYADNEFQPQCNKREKVVLDSHHSIWWLSIHIMETMFCAKIPYIHFIN